MCAHVHTYVYVSVYVLWAVQRPGQAVRDYGVCVGWGGWVSQNPDPIWPCSAQKVWREWLQAADLQTGRRSGRQARSQTDGRGREKQEWQRRRNGGKGSQRGKQRLKKQYKSRQTERRELWILIGRVGGHIITDNMHLFWFVLPLIHTRLSIFHHKNWAFSMHTTAQT